MLVTTGWIVAWGSWLPETRAEWVVDLGLPGVDGQNGAPGQDGTAGGDGGDSVLALVDNDGTLYGPDTRGGIGGNGGDGGDAVQGGAAAGSGGAGGRGGNAESRITVMLNQAPPDPDRHGVDLFANGGSGGNAGLPGNPLDGPPGDHGPAGDGGSASVHVTAGFTGDHAVDMGAGMIVRGGHGGHAIGGSGAAGRGGDVTASASVTGRDDALAFGEIFGGIGGDAENGTANAGDGGNAILGPVEVQTINPGGFAEAIFQIEAGEGGDSYNAGNAGNGGDAIAENQITVSGPAGSSLFVQQQVRGGIGGGVQFATANGSEQGVAGGATSVITIAQAEGDIEITNDAVGGDGGWRDGPGGRAGRGAVGEASSTGVVTTGASDVDAWAFGGSGGDAWNGADGGHGAVGTGSAIGKGSADVTAVTYSVGGYGGDVQSGNGSGGLGGDSYALADANSSEGLAVADATAEGGRSGSRAGSTRPADPSGNAVAEAIAQGATFNASATATGSDAAATASGSGASGLASASAGTEHSGFGGRFHDAFVGTSVEAAFGGEGNVGAHVSAAGWGDQPLPPPDRIAHSRVAHAADLTATSQAPGAGVPAGVPAATQPATRFQGTFGGRVTESVTAAADVTIENDFYFDVNEFAGHYLNFGLIDGELTEFDLFEFRIESPDTGFQQTWTWTESSAEASAFLADTQLALGQFAADGNSGLYQLETRLTWRGSSLDQQFSGGFLVATAVPEPSALLALSLAAVALGFRKPRHRLRIRKQSADRRGE